MFNKNLGVCQLTDDASNSLFGNIVGALKWDYRGDHSLLAVARALLYKRIETGEKFFVTVRKMEYSMDALTRNDCDQIISAVFSEMLNVGAFKLCVLSLNSSPEGNKRFLEIMDDPQNGFARYYGGYDFHEANDLRQYSENHRINARFYVSDESRTTVVLVDYMDIRRYHFVASLMPRFIKWWLDKVPITPEEIQFCKSLIANSSDEYEQAVRELCSKIDFRSCKIKRMLGGFEKKVRERQLRDAENDVTEIRQNIENNISRYRELTRRLDTALLNLNGVRDAVENANDDSELIQFIIGSKYIEPVYDESDAFGVEIRSYLDIFDPEVFNRLIEKDGSYILNVGRVSDPVFKNVWVRRKLLTAIFSEEPVLKIKTCAFFDINPICRDVGTERNHNFSSECNDMMPNPHLYYFACLGQNRAIMRERLLEGDMVGCLMQCIASTKCLNLCDSAVVSRFVQDLFNWDLESKIIELPDKRSVTVKEAYQWLIDQEQNENNTTTETPEPPEDGDGDHDPFI